MYTHGNSVLVYISIETPWTVYFSGGDYNLVYFLPNLYRYKYSDCVHSFINDRKQTRQSDYTLLKVY